MEIFAPRSPIGRGGRRPSFAVAPAPAGWAGQARADVEVIAECRPGAVAPPDAPGIGPETSGDSSGKGNDPRREGDVGEARTYALDREYGVEVPVTLAPRGVTWFVIGGGARDRPG